MTRLRSRSCPAHSGGKLGLLIRRGTLLPIAAVIVALIGAAWLQWAIAGLPEVPQSYAPPTEATIHGFPAWLIVSHYLNFLLLSILVRSGLQILMDHPRLYWNVHCTPGTEWARFTPVVVPTDRLWTSKDDARNLSAWIGLPGGTHTVGLSRQWHFVGVVFWVLNGAAFITLLFTSGQWVRLVPTSWRIVPDAWSFFVHYATLHLPAEPDGFYRYNPLQQLAYFGVVFVLAPLQIITAVSMSPALVNRFRWYPMLPGNRQVGRSIHFLIMCGFVAFFVAHVAMVAITGFAKNMNHITVGTNDARVMGAWIGLVGLVVVVAVNVFAHWASWKRSRLVQRVGDALINPLEYVLLDRSATAAEYAEDEISPFFWPNGKLPTSDEWTSLAEGGFEGYRLRVCGLVENPVEISLGELEALEAKQQITLHNCIQGWSGIASWRGVRMTTLFEHVRPKPEARFAVFYSFGEGAEGGDYFDSHSIADLRHPQALLAYEMNHSRLDRIHGAPLRLRVENQLGFKMVKWIRSIEFVRDYKSIGEGEGGYNEDNEFYDSLADI